MNKYFGNFEDRYDVASNFNVGTGNHYRTAEFTVAPDFPPEEDILFATYDTPDYEGSAFVLFTREDKLFEVNGSHCSCYGLEDQWEPEETSWDALAMRSWIKTYGKYDYRSGEAWQALHNLVFSHVEEK